MEYIEAKGVTKEDLVAEIRATMNQISQTAIMGAIKIGRDLKMLKELVPHGGWLEYIEENLSFSERKVQQFIQLAEEYGRENSPYFAAVSNPNMCADLSISNALRLLTVPEDQIEEFVEKEHPAELTVRELEEKIRALKAEREVEREDEEKRYEALRQEHDRLKEELDSEAVIDGESESEIEELKKQLEEKEKEVEQTKKQAEADLKKAKSEARSVEKELENARKEAEEAQGEARAARVEAEEAREEAQRAKAGPEKVLGEQKVRFKLLVDNLQKNYLEAVEAIGELPEEEQSGAEAALRQVMEALMEVLPESA